MSIRVFCPLFSFFIFSCMNCLYVLWSINPFLIMLLLLLSQVSHVQLYHWQIFLPFHRLSFCWMVSFAMQSFQDQLGSVCLFLLLLLFLRKQIEKKKKKATIYVKVFFLCILWSFMVLSPTFSFKIYFHLLLLLLVYCVRKCSNFIVLLGAVFNFLMVKPVCTLSPTNVLLP